MKIEVFDDWYSIGHLIVGVFSYFFVPIFVVFLFYELVEKMFKERKEKVSTFLGDLCEFFIGVAATHFVLTTINI